MEQSGSGKYLWTGFELNDIVGGKSDLDQFQKFDFKYYKMDG